MAKTHAPVGEYEYQILLSRLRSLPYDEAKQLLADALRDEQVKEAEWWLGVVRDVANDAGIEPQRCADRMRDLRSGKL